MQLLSHGSQYAISALIALARHEVGKAVSAADLARPLKCPAAYLSQTLAKLTPSGILETRRGLNGGVYLLKPASQITIYEVVSIIDGEEFFESCLLGIRGCGHIEPCPFHNFWSKHRNQIREWMTITTIAQASDQMSDQWFDLRLNFV
jgi:Rrf2 family transcriptional regulator, iron-sulfur cluster assembly transcription factor